jgi:imidazoleglycerol-phosphate dehydratase
MASGLGGVVSASMARSSIQRRNTAETRIEASWSLDETAEAQAATGVGFFDHMLTALGKHSRTALAVRCDGDLHIDAHHTTEDVGIALGMCLRECLGDRRGVERFGHMACPLDEALVTATVDLSGRPFLVCDLQIPAATLGTWPTELVEDFFQALCDQARITVHLHQQGGRNSHHIVEAAFKAFARALGQAVRITGSDMPSTKGMLG